MARKKAKEKKEPREPKGLKELRETLQRVQADFENAMKRKEKEMQIAGEKAKASVLKEFLPVLDSLEEALKHSPEDAGLKQLHSQLLQAFRKNRVSEIDAGGQFSPHSMECMMRASEPGKENDAVLEVFQKGYMLNGSVLRPAKVKINVHEEKKKGHENAKINALEGKKEEKGDER